MLDRISKYAAVATPIVMLISVPLVIVEMKRNTAAIQTATSQELVGLQLQLDDWLKDDEMVSWWLQAQKEPEQAACHEVRLTQASRWVRNKMNLFEHIYFSWKDGSLREPIFEAWSASYLEFLCNFPLANHVFTESLAKNRYAAPFEDYVRTKIEPKCALKTLPLNDCDQGSE